MGGISMSDAALITDGKKRCRRCRVVKVLDCFCLKRPERQGAARWAPCCKECVAKRRAYDVSTSDRIRTARRALTLRRYGVSPEKYNAMFIDQRGCCAICLCHQTEMKRRLVVDHDHATNAVRGLLCDACNIALGAFHEDTETLVAAIEYLRRHKAV